VSDSDHQSRFLKLADRIGSIIESALLVFVLSAMILLAAGQILMRNLLDSGVAWGDEALRIMLLWLVMLGAVAASRERRHIVIDVLSRLLPGVLKTLTAAAVDCLTAVVTGLLAWFSWQFVSDSRIYGDVLLNTVPAWTLQIILPVGFALISYRYLVWCVRHLRDALHGVDR